MKNVGRHNGEIQFSTVMAVTILLGSRSLFTNLKGSRDFFKTAREAQLPL